MDNYQMNLFTATMQKLFSIFFLLHHTLANGLDIIRPLDQEDTLANITGSFLIDDSALTGPSRGNLVVVTSSDISSKSEPGSQQQNWIQGVASPFVAGSQGTHCTGDNANTFPDQILLPNRFKRRLSSPSATAQLSRRKKSEASCSNSQAAHQLENAPSKQQEPRNLDRAPLIVDDVRKRFPKAP